MSVGNLIDDYYEHRKKFLSYDEVMIKMDFDNF